MGRKKPAVLKRGKPLKRTRLKRTKKPLSRKKWVKRPSHKKKVEGQQFRDTMIAVRRRSGGACEIGMPSCLGIAREGHHRVLRSQGGPSDVPELIFHLCANCHSAVHRNPEKSIENGWIIPGWVYKLLKNQEGNWWDDWEKRIDQIYGEDDCRPETLPEEYHEEQKKTNTFPFPVS